MKKLKQQKGITLVALVITIIILLILAGISIQALTNTGLFGKAQEAKNVTEEKAAEENETLENYLAQINEITGEGKKSKPITGVDKNKTDPESAMPSGATVIEGDATNGIVIKDSKNNEWVWVEVPKTEVFKGEKSEYESDNKYDNIKDDLIAYAREYREGKKGQGCNWTDEWYAKNGSTLVTESTEGLTDAQKKFNNGCGLTYDEYKAAYQKMLNSVYTNGGFWISRYEIGDSTATAGNTTRTNSMDSRITGIAVSQANMIPYNYVTCSEAQTLAKGMTSDSSKTSSLLFGIQWDLTCIFLEKNSNLTNLTKDNIKSNSTSWGNYSNAKVTSIKTGAKQLISSGTWTASTEDKAENRGILLTTGASEQTNKMNIYDFAGNENEWTLEKTSITDFPCARRGGFYGNVGSNIPASVRSDSNTTRSDDSIGFRSALY